jgi:hypothetical protein
MLNKENPRLKIETMVYCNTFPPQHRYIICMHENFERKENKID